MGNKVVFSSYNTTTVPLLERCAERVEVYVFRHQKSNVQMPANIKFLRADYSFKVLERILSKLQLDKVRPEKIKDLQKELSCISPDKLFVSDFYNLTFYQCLQFKIKNPKTKLFLWSETRAWPRLWITRWIMYGFWHYFIKNSSYIEKVFVFTEAGKKFFNSNAPEVVVEVLPAPIDTKLFYLSENKNYAPNHVLRLIMNARFIPLKEHKTFFQAVARLKKQGLTLQASLVGRGGHLEDELRLYADMLGIKDQLVWLSPVPHNELRHVYQEHDVLVLPSNREAIGMVVPEAMACGLATVTSSAVGANTYVKEKETGLVFESGNVEALIGALEQISKKGVAEAYGKKGAKVIREQYSVEVLGEKLLKTLKN